LKNYNAIVLIKINDFFPDLIPSLYKVLIAQEKFDVKKMDSNAYMSLMYLSEHINAENVLHKVIDCREADL